MISPEDGARPEADRRRHGLALTRGNLKLEAAVMIQPGHADDAVSISLGYGRAKCGRVGKDVGFNANLIRTSRRLLVRARASRSPPPASATRTRDHAGARHHGRAQMPSISNDRPLVREATIEEYKKNAKVDRGDDRRFPSSTRSIPKLNYDKGNQWGMAIDLTSCTGCNACVVACAGGKQHSGGRQGSGAARPRNALDPHGSLLRRATRTIREVVEQPHPVHAVRERALRKRLPGAGDHAQSRRPERHGVQPLRRHAVLRQQLSLQGAPLQLPQLPQATSRTIIGMVYNPDVTRPYARRHGKVHLLRAAHPGNQDQSQARTAAARSRTARSRPPASRPARPTRSCSAISTTPIAGSRN